MDSTIKEKGTPTSIEKQAERSHFRHIAFVHLTRLAWLALTVIVILLFTILIRNLTSSAGFFVEQQVNVIAVIVGLALVAIVYTLGIRRMLSKIREWEHQGKTTLVTGSLLGLGITPILMALPIVIMFLIH